MAKRKLKTLDELMESRMRNHERLGKAGMKALVDNLNRQVLKELIGWWIGCQPAGREMGEKHRRFYHRFGVDVGTALTLNGADTDALFATVTEGFTHDMV